MLQIEWFWYFWTTFLYFLATLFHHGWIKCWNLVFWNARDWLILISLTKITLFFSNITSPWLKKVYNLVIWNAPDWLHFDHFDQHFFTFEQHYFTMVDEIFEIWCSKMLQITNNNNNPFSSRSHSNTTHRRGLRIILIRKKEMNL